MLEESLPSILASVYGWFTPTVLFVLLNLMIGTIAVSSGLGTKKNPAKEGKQPPLTRAPSVLERLKSINLYRYRSEEVNPFPSVTTTVQPLERMTYQTIEELAQEEETLDHNQEQDHNQELDHNQEQEHEEQLNSRNVARSMSDTKSAAGFIPVKLPKKMRKSASSKSAFGHFEEEEIVDRLRPSTVKEGKSRASELQQFGEDDEVDAKADDFINKFKQQLKLQRLDSIIRYKEMLTRGAK
ncbi:pathogen-associated molecular patterns-induced protein A70-like [Telopea speciosissima]|uniref:pathogen-associated molecular patterns-induced protein A70-like n=1 Tax=Telopea speciosissima TaxID=54955 RepID=UPI001CC79D03|nr:pathogen-associated molecular patterns-induced protein A70-like [Telopea speciosissima]